jgi:mRNA-degrading endonuclease RelE of RelBE toxin-antitoxin system
MTHRILARIEELATDPRPVGCRKLQGGSGLWRLRVGDYRVVYSVDDGQKLVDVKCTVDSGASLIVTAARRQHRISPKAL